MVITLAVFTMIQLKARVARAFYYMTAFSLNLGGRGSEVRGQKSEVRSQRSDSGTQVRDQGSGLLDFGGLRRLVLLSSYRFAPCSVHLRFTIYDLQLFLIRAHPR
jgi:hypothetical protein